MTRELAKRIAENLAEVRERMGTAARQADRDPAGIRLVAITKTFPAETVRAAYDVGLREFGENRVQEFEEKWKLLQPAANMPGAQFHMIGHLQSNKVSSALAFDWLQTLDSERLARRLNELAEVRGKRLRVLLQVKLGEELARQDRKTGAAVSEVGRLAALLSSLANLDPQGLMLIPPFTEDPEGARPFFTQLKAIQRELQAAGHQWVRELSMGMSHDYPIAIAEGATMIRLGTALFGPRRAGQ